jgi:threonine dehydratase
VEVDTSAPLRASLAQGSPATVTPTPSFVDGIGGKSVFAEMWPLVSTLLEGTRVVSVPQIASAIRLLAERCRIVAEGAGAAPVAAALDGAANGTLDARRVVCVVSGGNINSGILAAILGGDQDFAG